MTSRGRESGPRNIYLAGFMGSGKSTVGRILARRLGLGFKDLDEEVERLAGAAVPAVFESRGEAGFRALERRALLRLGRLKGCVVALGGGTLMDRRNRALAAATGVTVHLQCSQAELRRRLASAAGGRPLLGGAELGDGAGGFAGRLRALLRARAAGYASADARVRCSGRTAARTAADIETLLRAAAHARRASRRPA